MKSLLILAALLAAAPATAKPGLTAHVGETWLFRIDRGRPVAARLAKASDAPAANEVRLTLTAVGGTMMSLLNNSPRAYTYRAALVGADGKISVAKSCVLPANGRLALESWPQRAVAVRVSDFAPTSSAACR